MAVIRIKRSTGTSVPGSLKTAEIAYAMGTGTQANAGDRLFFGKGDDGSGNATSIVVIGGEYFTNMLDHVAGTLTASSAIIVDADKKIDNLKVDNLDLNGNTISSTDTNGNIVISPNGSGTVDVDTSRIVNVTDPTSNQDAATKKYVDDQFSGGSTIFTLDADGGTPDAVAGQETITFVGGTGLTSAVANNQITYTLDNTLVSPGSYGSATQIPTFTVDQQGRLTAAGTADVATSLTVNGDGATTDTVSLLDSDITFTGGSGITTTVTNNTVTIAGDDASTSAKGVAQFSSDNFAVSSGLVTIKDGGVANAELANSSITINSKTISLGGSDTLSTSDIGEGTNLYYTSARADSDAKNAISGGTGVTYTPATGVIAIGQDVGTGADVVFNSLTTSNGLVVEGNLQVNGTTVTVNSTTLEVTDNMIYMNAGESDGSPTQFVDVGWAANVNETGTYYHVGMFRDATDGVFKLYHEYTPEPDSDVQINTAHPSFAYAPFRAGTLTGKYLGFDSDFSDKSTTDLTEGSNLYYTTARADSDFDARLAIKTTTNLTEGDNLYYTTARADSDFDARLAIKTTDNLTEGSNLYYTDERVDDRLNNLLLAGEGIDLTYVDNGGSPGTLTIAAELATISNPGVASFDSNEFDIVGGAVTLDTIDGGTF